jgi:hypothetical protein
MYCGTLKIPIATNNWEAETYRNKLEYGLPYYSFLYVLGKCARISYVLISLIR